MAASKYGLIKDEVASLQREVGKLLSEVTDGSGTHSRCLVLEQQLSRFYHSHNENNAKLESNSLDCAFVALTKSGKSTLLNAICGANILPSNNVPETARIVSIEHQRLAEGEKPSLVYKADGQVIKVEEDARINAEIEFLNREVRDRQHRPEDEAALVVRTEIAALQHADSEDDILLKLLDTPGPNESGEDALKHSVERLLDSVDAVVYILDYTKLKTNEETLLLRKLQSSNPQLVERLAQRLFFVVNKVDMMHTCEGLQEDELRHYVANLVTKQMNTPAFQLRPEQIFLVSAQDALLSRLILLDKATSRDRERFARKAFGRTWVRRTDAEFKREAQEILEESHILDLEDCLLTYLYNHAGSLKLVSLLDSIVRMLTRIQNVAVTGEAALKQSAEALETEAKELQATLLATGEKFGAVQAESSEVEHEVIDSVQARMQNLKERLFSHIQQVLDTEHEPQSLPEARRAGWRRVWEKSTSFFTRGGGHPDESDSVLRAKLGDLHKDVKAQIEHEIGDFWHDLEIATNEKHHELLNVINAHLAELAREIESVVGSALDLKLEPVDICLKPPSAAEFHNSIQDLFANGIRATVRTETRLVEESQVVWEQRYRGLCRQTPYYIGVPIKKTVCKEEQVTSYDPQLDKIKASTTALEYFFNMVNQSVETSIRHVRTFVHLFMSDKIDAARQKIASYSEIYSETMIAALTAKSQSVDEQEAGLVALQGHIKQIAGLLQAANRIMQDASRLFPQVDSASFDWVTDPEMLLEEPREGPPAPSSDAKDEPEQAQKNIEPSLEAVAPEPVTERSPLPNPSEQQAAPSLQDLAKIPPGTPTVILQLHDILPIMPTGVQPDAGVQSDSSSENSISEVSIYERVPSDSSSPCHSEYLSEEVPSIYSSETEEEEEEDYSSESEEEEENELDESSEEDEDFEESESEEAEVSASDSDDDDGVESHSGDVESDDGGVQSGNELRVASQREQALAEIIAAYPELSLHAHAAHTNTPANPSASPAELAGREELTTPVSKQSQPSAHSDSASDSASQKSKGSVAGTAQAKAEESDKEGLVGGGGKMSASWHENMAPFMTGLGITDPNPELPLSNAHSRQMESTEVYSATPTSTSSDSLNIDPAHFEAEAADSQSVSTDWECIEDEDFKGHA